MLSICGLPEARPLLLEQLDSPDDETRIQAACALQNMDMPVGSQHVRVLRETLARTPESRPSERTDIALLLEKALAATQ
ncbi:MAG: armadillo/beta-catenin-like repeat-containing protein [Stenotrophomonas sp.]